MVVSIQGGLESELGWHRIGTLTEGWRPEGQWLGRRNDCPDRLEADLLDILCCQAGSVGGQSRVIDTVEDSR